ncbi:hypothetical protein DLM86_05460 [Paenibacillus flagellatus]|uniref:ABC transporter substrate-binding protein n=1 Tax=Paenibacillus flagellatus TaxID=2211139 RepID=A0A2V5KDT9_9BACL|nr:hypothetical protein DLM86_05460 [Paenibacillus flagellatus]
MKSRGIWAGLTALAVLSTSACGGGGDGGKEGTGANPGNGAAGSGGPVTLKIMGNYEKADLTDGDKKMIELLEKKTNTKLEFEIPPLTGYKERLQLMLASGNYPDLVFFPDPSDPSFLNAVKDGVVVPVNDYIKNAPNLTKHTYDTSWSALQVNQDGKIYGVPRTSVTRYDQYWVRKDWLANVGISIPDNAEVTIDQFTDILRKFTKNDPDKNGKNDTYGLAVGTNSRKVLDPDLTGAFGLTGWQKANGGKYEFIDPKYDPANDGYKKSLAYSAMLHKEGLVDPDAATNDATKARERFWRGVTGVYLGFAGHYSWHTGELRKHNPNADLTYVFVKDDKGTVKGGGYATGLWGFWALTKSAKHPQKAIELLDAYLADDVWPIVVDGFEGMDYKVENGKKVLIKSDPPPPTPAGIRRNTMRRANDYTFFASLSEPKEVTDLITPWMKKSLDTVVRGKDVGFIPEASKKPAMLDYQKVWDQTTMKIILGEQPVDKFDELLTGWYKAGGEEYVKQMNEFIKKLESGGK